MIIPNKVLSNIRVFHFYFENIIENLDIIKVNKKTD